MSKIHPTAVVSEKAKIGKNVTIEPFAVIYDDVEVGDDVYIGPHAALHNGSRVGNRVKIYQGASIAHIPQDLKFSGEATTFTVGDDTTIHEFCTLHRGTEATKNSSVGSKCLLMAYVHVAHDCVIGNNCILANGVQVGGHVHIDDWVTIGGMTPVHQFCKIGEQTMIGGGFRVVKDVPPFVLAGNEPLKYAGLNLIGLRRRGFSADDINVIKKAYGYIYGGALPVTKAKEKLREELSENPHVKRIIEFIDSSDRGLIGKV